MDDEDKKAYQVYAYRGPSLTSEQRDLGEHGERLLAEAIARDAVVRDGYRTAHVMRCRDLKIVYYYDIEEMS